MNKFKFLRKVKKCTKDDVLVIYVNDLEDNTLTQVRNVKEMLEKEFPNVKHLFAYKCDVMSYNKSIDLLKEKIKEMQSAVDVLELEQEIRKEENKIGK